jgi:DNA-directed RNA polymerase subunit RPC12/RpoP
MLRGNQNKSGLCIFHNREKTITKNRNLRREQHLCINCGKDIKPRMVYYIRCDECMKRYNYKDKHKQETQ